ncbi:hypothetical protein M9458_031219, partial [Cirrhinus mrigala]
ADVQVFHVAHVCSGNRRLCHHDVPDQRHLRVGQHRLHAAAAAAHPLPESRQQLGLHQSGAHLPPGTCRDAALESRARPQTTRYSLFTHH